MERSNRVMEGGEQKVTGVVAAAAPAAAAALNYLLGMAQSL